MMASFTMGLPMMSCISCVTTPTLAQNFRAVLYRYLMYSATSGEAMFAERYDACAIAIPGIGGEGGGTLNITSEITYGGTRTVGTVKKGSSGAIEFTAA